MDELYVALRNRFPLLTSLRILHSDGETEDLAAFMGILLSAMQRGNGSSFCFVLPRKRGLATLSAALYALGQFAVDFPSLAEEYAKRGFTEGQRVKLLPEDEVFEFGGVWPGLEKWFRLRLLDDKRKTSFNWPITDILRISPTARKIPKGREGDIHKARAEAPLSVLDKLIGTRTFGNLSLAKNYVLLLGGRSEIEDFLATTSLAGSGDGVRSTLDCLIVPGLINDSGKIRHQDNYQAAGEPLMAISSRLENVAAVCRGADMRSKVVIVDGAKRITDLAQFDSIAESQNLIILAEPDEEEKLQQLHDRGCKFWRFTLADLELGEAKHQSRRFFNGIFRSAQNEANYRTEVLNCSNLYLEEVARALEVCERGLKEADGDETWLVLRQIYRLLVHCSGLLAPPNGEEQLRLQEIARALTTAAEGRLMWLPDAVATALVEACAAINYAIEDPELGLVKGDALKDLLSTLRVEGMGPFAILARSQPNKVSVSGWLEEIGINCPVIVPSCAADSGFFERLVCPTWPGSGRFGQTVKKFLTPQICLIAYPFESAWLSWFERRQRSMQIVPNLTSEEKSRLLGVTSDIAWSPEAHPPIFAAVPPQGNGHVQVDLEQRMSFKGLISGATNGEDTVQARLVSFSGDAYAFLGDSFRLPVITDLLSGSVGATSKIPRRGIADINAGDVLVFRESGRRDVIQSLADAQLGSDASAIRERAAQWHRALRESGLDESMLMTELQKFNCPRALQTVRGWLADDSLIGPQTKADLEAIAYAVGDQKLLDDVSLIWNAILVIRSEHLSAGMRLSQILMEKLPERLGEIEEGRTRIEIDNATSAWIVQVENVAEHSELRPRSYVNTLLWDSEDFL